MLIALHKNARASVLAQRFGITEQTVYKWKKREVFGDRSHTAHRLQTVLTPAQEVIVVHLRRTLMLPLDDLLAVTREFLSPDVSRSGLDRCLRRHGVGSLGALKLVSDIHGHSARGMIKSLIEGRPLHEILDGKGRLRASREALGEALSTEQFSADHRFVAGEIMQHIEQIEQRIQRMDEYLLQGLQAYKPQLNLLQTIPGIDRIGAAMLLVEISTDMTVFGSAERLASWVGICPGNNESAGKRKSGRIRRGNAWVRRLLCEFAQAAARTRCAFKAKFDSLAIRKGYKKSIIALAHKMLRTIYAMLATATCYQDRSVDYEALCVARNAPRWLKMLRKHGFIAASPAV